MAYDDFQFLDLRQPLDLPLRLAEKFDMKLHVENEVVCNVVDLSQLYALVADYEHPRQASRRFVAIGEGDIPLESMLAATFPAHSAPLTLTIETHASLEPEDTTRRSISGLRRMLDELRN